uniref:Predicted protein n=2 Tax=Mesangiospermae TaxID=1437183 RepID=F2E809_HORVV|nr:predicted protein [Hordeum vulgare subsp. vulgare]
MSQKNRAFDQFVLSIYGNRLFGASLSQVKEWEEEREAVEWVRAKAQPNSTVYYELRPPLNLLAVTEIAGIVS